MHRITLLPSTFSIESHVEEPNFTEDVRVDPNHQREVNQDDDSAANRIAKLMRQGQSISYKDQVREPRRSRYYVLRLRDIRPAREAKGAWERRNSSWRHRAAASSG